MSNRLQGQKSQETPVIISRIKAAVLCVLGKDYLHRYGLDIKLDHGVHNSGHVCIKPLSEPSAAGRISLNFCE